LQAGIQALVFVDVAERDIAEGRIGQDRARDGRVAADPTAAVVVAISARGDLSETVVRVVVKLRQEQEPQLVEREIVRALEGAYFVASLQKDVERTERQRLGAVSVESLTPAELLERYLQVKEVPAERAKLLLEHCEALIQMVDGGSAL
jgi:hypothetical protein